MTGHRGGWKQSNDALTRSDPRVLTVVCIAILGFAGAWLLSFSELSAPLQSTEPGGKQVDDSVCHGLAADPVPLAACVHCGGQ